MSEKRPQQRNGGCVSTFFNLFSKSHKKLLPPPVKQAAMEFDTDGRMPEAEAQALVIEDENHGRLPELKSVSDTDIKARMQGPGLVARLMGLECIPVVHSEQPEKALDSTFCNDDSFELANIDQGLSTDCGSSGKVELRMQKLEKTEKILERRPVKPFCKGFISGSRKTQYMKLEMPVKSPRLLSRSNSSKLVQAVANKILEPGLHARSQAKFALSYRGSMEGHRDRYDERSNDSVVLVGECVSSASDTNNRHVENKRVQSGVIPSEQRKKELAATRFKMKAEEEYKMKVSVVPGTKINNRSLAIQAKKLNVESRARNLIGREKNIASSGGRVIPGTKNELNRAKNFVALNKNLNNSARSRSPTRVSGSHRIELERGGCEKNMTQKRRAINQNQNVGAFNTNFAKERSVKSDVINRKETGPASYHGRNSRKVDCESFRRSNENGIVSFTFNSPVRNGSHSRTHEEIIKMRVHDEVGRDACHTKMLVSDVNIGSLSSQNGMALRGDELSSLLEDKIRELSCLDRDELASRDDHQGKSTVSILEELISALTMGDLKLHERNKSCSDVSARTDNSKSQNQMVNSDEEFQGKAKARITTSYLTGANNQPSPISVLEAPFSNESCSLSIDGSSGDKPQFGLLESSNKSYPNADLFDSATSLNISQLGEFKTDEAISDAELVFENISLYNSYPKKESSFSSFLLDIQENIMDNVFCEGNHLREFLLDCVMECMESKLSHFCSSGYKAWLRLPSILKRDRLIREVREEIIEWKNSGGIRPDNLIQKEMDRSNLKWAECGVEAYEVGVEIQSDILQSLIDDMVIEIC